MKKNFKNKIYRAFLFGFTITILASAVTVFGFAMPSIRNSNLKSEQEMTYQTMRRIDEYLEQANSLCSQVSYTRSTRDILKKYYDGSMNGRIEYTQDAAQMFQLYQDFLLPYGGIYGIFIYNLYGQPYYFCPSEQVDRYYDIESEAWYLELQEATRYGQYILSGAHHPPQLRGNSSFISLYRNIYDIDTYKIAGQAELLIRPQALSSILEDSLKNRGNQNLTLVDASGTVVVSTDGQQPGDSYDKKIFNWLISHDHNTDSSDVISDDTVSASLSDYSGWYLVNEYSASVLYEDSYTIILSFVFFSLLAWIAMAIWGRIISRQVTKPLALLSDGISHIEKGDFDTRIVINSNDEFDDLANSFNRMAETLKNYIQHIYDIEQQKTEAQMSALQAQINPHFTLNTINCVKHMAMLQNSDNIVSMLNDFSLLLTAAFRFPNELITVREELNRIRAFARIQNVASFGKIRINIQCKDELQECLTLGLILQPIVENSIFHGIKPKMSSHQIESGNISIQVSSAEGTVLIHVVDDGIGMPQDEADALLSESHSGIGVINVQRRIQLRFGEEYGLSIKTAPQKGCDVLIQIPKIQK